MMELRVGAQYWNTSAKRPGFSCQSGALSGAARGGAAEQRSAQCRSRSMPSATSASAFGVIMSGLCQPTLCQPRSSTTKNWCAVRGLDSRAEHGAEHRAHHDVGLGAEAVARRSASGQVEDRDR